MAVPWSEVFTGIGLLMNITGVWALTITDVFASKPFRTWWFYIRHVDPENPEATEKDPPVDVVFPAGGGLAGMATPGSTESYNRLKSMVKNQSIAIIGLVGGFLFQFIALFL